MDIAPPFTYPYLRLLLRYDQLGLRCMVAYGLGEILFAEPHHARRPRDLLMDTSSIRLELQHLVG